MEENKEANGILLFILKSLTVCFQPKHELFFLELKKAKEILRVKRGCARHKTLLLKSWLGSITPKSCEIYSCLRNSFGIYNQKHINWQ